MSLTSETPPELIPLPQPCNASGEPRRVGVEVEFSGLTEEKAARVLADTLGGAASEEKPGKWSVTGTGLGDFECYLDSAPLNKMDRDGIGKSLRELARTVVAPSEDLSKLTPSEQRVAEMAASGATNKDIAAAMFISAKTVEHNLTKIYRKLGISSRAELGRSQQHSRASKLTRPA